MTKDLETVGRKRILDRQSTSNLFNFDTEGFTLRSGSSNFPVFSGNIIQRLRSGQATVFGKGFYSQVSDLQSGGATGVDANFSLVPPVLEEDIEGTGSVSFVGTLSGAYRGLADGAIIALDNFISDDILGVGVWVDTYDHAYSKARFNFAFYKNLGRSDGSTTTTFSVTMPRYPLVKILNLNG